MRATEARILFEERLNGTGRLDPAANRIVQSGVRRIREDLNRSQDQAERIRRYLAGVLPYSSGLPACTCSSFRTGLEGSQVREDPLQVLFEAVHLGRGKPLIEQSCHILRRGDIHTLKGPVLLGALDENLPSVAA